MSVVIRLSRIGKKGERKFRVVVKEKRSKRDGKAIENLGFYIKGADEASAELALPAKRDKGGRSNLKINKDRYNYWISVGAKPSPAVENLLKE